MKPRIRNEDVARDRLQFVLIPAPSTEDLKGLVRRIAERIGRSLERSALMTRDIENAYLAFDPGEEAPIDALLGASITYRIATGPREGQRVFTLQTLVRLKTPGGHRAADADRRA